jgi:hypothetical protein
VVRRIPPSSGDAPTTTVPQWQPTRPLPRRRAGLACWLAPWALVAVGALIVLAVASTWSAFLRTPDAPHVHTAVQAAPPPTPASPPTGTVQWVAADDNRIAIAPRPTAVRGSVGVPPKAAKPPVMASAPAAETVPVVAPPAKDSGPVTCVRPTADPQAPVECSRIPAPAAAPDPVDPPPTPTR